MAHRVTDTGQCMVQAVHVLQGGSQPGWCQLRHGTEVLCLVLQVLHDTAGAQGCKRRSGHAVHSKDSPWHCRRCTE